MKRLGVNLFVLLACAVLVGLTSAPAYAVDGVVLINQNTATSGLPGCGSSGFPIVICQPGSYKLSGNLVVIGTTDAIEINADNVTLDLGGFNIGGPNSCTGAPVTSCTGGSSGSGISISGNSVTVKNGSVRGMNTGVFSNGEATLVEDLQSSQNAGNGIGIRTGTIRHSLAAFNGAGGIVIASGVVEGNVSEYNQVGGIEIGFDSTTSTDGVTILGNSIVRNGGFGLYAQYCLYGSNILKLNGLGSVAIVPGGDVTSQKNNSCDGSSC